MTFLPDAPWAALGLARVVNAAGKMTYLGSSAVSAPVAEALSAGARSYVDMAQLKEVAARRAADLVGAPAACIVSCAAAGIVQAVAAAITGTDLALIEQVPFVDVPRREVVLQKSHAIHFGAPLTQMVRLGGGVVVEIGSANRAAQQNLEAALGDRTAAVLFAVTHHARPEIALALDAVVAAAHARGVPVIVDAAAETDLRRFLALDADLVIYSGHKAIGGPTSGLVVGTPSLVAAGAALEDGAGRAMKVGKETIAGLLAALEQYVCGEPASPADMEVRLGAVVAAAGDNLPVSMSTAWDASRPIPRLRIHVKETSPVTARELTGLLEASHPSIRTRNHDIDRGVIVVDPRELDMDEAALVGATLRSVLEERTGDSQ